MKAALYARISTADKGQNTEVQLTELRAYAKQRDWDVVGEFADVISGKQSKRPQLDAMMKLARQRRMRVIVIIRLSRLGRSLSHLITVVSELQQYGVNLVSVNEAIDLDTPNGRLMFHLFGALAQFEAELISERVRAGLAYAKFCGAKIGRPAMIGDKTVEAAFEMRSQGMSIRNIAKALSISPSATHVILAKGWNEACPHARPM